MSKKYALGFLFITGLCLFLLGPSKIAAQPAATYYLTFRGGTSPSVLSSTMTPAPTIVRRGPGSYRISFPQEYNFLVGTAKGIYYGSGEYQSTLLMATKDPQNPKQWYIDTVALAVDYSSQGYRSYFNGQDADFSIIVRLR